MRWRLEQSRCGASEVPSKAIDAEAGPNAHSVAT